MTARASDFSESEEPRDARDAGSDHDPVADAQRIVSAETDCSLNEALVKMENLAAATDESLEIIANLVLNGEIDLS
ncbi:MAG TPA: hypothetical protein VK771_09885 [Acidimicrobiia bacterium]|nr:hypothetical protein [Acidimicrobiia bacterium]